LVFTPGLPFPYLASELHCATGVEESTLLFIPRRHRCSIATIIQVLFDYAATKLLRPLTIFQTPSGQKEYLVEPSDLLSDFLDSTSQSDTSSGRHYPFPFTVPGAVL
jgi:hypothetical protein